MPTGGGLGRRIIRLLSVGLMGLGVLLLAGTAAVYGYSYWMGEQARADPWLRELEAGWRERSDSVASAAAPAAVQPTTADQVPAPEPAVGRPIPTAVATAASTATPRAYPPAVGIRIPSIGVDSRVVGVGIVDGQYEVPAFYVGHYEGTAHPGQTGNGVYSGHLESARGGDVFARLSAVELGDEVLIYTIEGVWRHRVTEIKEVPNTEVEVMAPGRGHVVTLVTCTGTWNPVSRDYSHRLVVTAELVNLDAPLDPGGVNH